MKGLLVIDLIERNNLVRQCDDFKYLKKMSYNEFLNVVTIRKGDDGKFGDFGCGFIKYRIIQKLFQII